ncbi:MAG: pyridoxal-dependent decarboxylase [Planctomycetaceae bacterium]
MNKRFHATPAYGDLSRSGGQVGWGDYSGLPDVRTGGSDSIDAWFLGPKGENAELFSSLVQEAINAAVNYRRYFHPEDHPSISETARAAPEYLESVGKLKYQFNILLQKLNEFATPYTSLRYQGHMLWDTTLPAMLGYFATMLHNPNNVTVQASTLTTFLGMVVGEDLCEMIGFDSQALQPWGHITADGSLANIEATWASRELKFLPISIRYALINDPAYHDAGGLEVTLLDGSRKALVKQTTWSLMNLKMDDILILPGQIAEILNRDPADIWQDLLHKYSINTVGWFRFYEDYMDGFRASPVIIVPSTKHYSWPKAAAVTGLGCDENSVIDIWVDPMARMDLDRLRQTLNSCLNSRTPVILTVAVMGSTEESAVDPLKRILEIREEFRAKGLEFNIHGDAAWGGYLISTLRKDFDEPTFQFSEMDEVTPPVPLEPFLSDDSSVHLSAHTKTNMKCIRYCDSVTVDPHKCGYIQYPAGAILYRNTDLKNLVTFGAPVIGVAGSAPSVGQFGLEGSKPGAAAAAVWLSHAVIRPSVSGYGKLLNAALLNAKLFTMRLWLMARPEDCFVVTPLAPLPRATEGSDAMEQLRKIQVIVRSRGIREFLNSATAADLRFFNELGPDQQIVDYTFNFRRGDGTLNKCLADMNSMNAKIYDALHVQEGRDVNQYDLLITQTEMSVSDYGDAFIQSYLDRMKITRPEPGNCQIYVNRSVVMDPWIDSTPSGKGNGNFFDVIFDVLRRTAEMAAKPQKS